MTITSLRDGRFVDVNKSFEKQSGYAREEVIGRTAYELGLWADDADLPDILADHAATWACFHTRGALADEVRAHGHRDVFR